MAGEKFELPIGIPVDTNAAEAADAVEGLREQIEGSTADIRAMSGTLRQLRGDSDEVKAAKAQLTAKIDALKNSVSGASLALVKQGTSYDAAAQRAKKLAAEQTKLAAEQKKSSEALKKDETLKAADRTKALSSAISTAGGPVASLKGKLDSLKSVLGETGGSSGLGLVTLGAATAAAAVAALVVAVGAGAYALARFVLQSANAARSANLMREAWSGTADNASNLGTQIDALAAKVPTSKAALNELATALMKTKLGGQATVDAFNAIGQASAALGDEAGGKIKEFIERGRVLGRFRIDPHEMLEGFGNLNFDDVAASLAKGMKVGVNDAKKALFEGRVKLGDGAKALRDAIEAKFGGLNLRKMMSFEVLAEKLKEKLASLTSGVNLEPLLKPLAEVSKLFDNTTVTGQSLKLLVTAFGTGVVKVLEAGIPIAEAFFQGLVIGALEGYIAFLKVRKALRDTFGDSETLKNVDALKLALDAGKVAAYGIAGAVVVVGTVAAAALAPIAAVVAAVTYAATLFPRLGKSMREALEDIDWKASGKAIIDGLIEGIKSGVPGVKDVVKSFAGSLKNAFTGPLEIHSPSRVFARYGEALPAGVEGGVEKGAPGAQKAVESMVTVPASSSGSGGSSGAAINVYVTINASGGDAGGLSSPSFLAQLTKAVEEALVGAGIPVLT